MRVTKTVLLPLPPPPPPPPWGDVCAASTDTTSPAAPRTSTSRRADAVPFVPLDAVTETKRVVETGTSLCSSPSSAKPLGKTGDATSRRASAPSVSLHRAAGSSKEELALNVCTRGSMSGSEQGRARGR